MLDSKIPSGPLEEKWTDYKGHCKLVNPANKRKLEIIIVGPVWPVHLQQHHWVNWAIR